jgi:hypothetical protein
LPLRWRRSSSVAGVVAAFTAIAACSPHSDDPQTAVVVGVQSEALNGALGTLHVVTTLGGSTFKDETLAPSQLPHEVHVVPAGGDLSAPVGVRVDGYTQPNWTPGTNAAPVLVRTAETAFVANETRLLRVLLQGQCLLALPGGPPGAPVCVAPTTCIGGTCQNDSLPPQALEPFTADWPTSAPDACKPANPGPPAVQVGTGQTDYLPVTTGEMVQAEQGPQGGHHIWIATREQNLKQSGSVTTITSIQPSTGLVGPTMAFAFTFETDEGGFCKLSGLRYQLDLDSTDYHLFLGKELDVTVVIKDMSGATGTGVAHIDVAPTILCPTGVPGC